MQIVAQTRRFGNFGFIFQSLKSVVPSDSVTSKKRHAYAIGLRLVYCGPVFQRIWGMKQNKTSK